MALPKGERCVALASAANLGNLADNDTTQRERLMELDGEANGAGTAGSNPVY